MLTLLIPTVVAIVSWFVGSWLSVTRDRANKRRDLRVQYLIEAYRRLATATERKETTRSISQIWTPLLLMFSYSEAQIR